LKDQVFEYDDPIKLFLTSYLRKVSYLSELSDDAFHDVLFNFRQSTFERGAYIFKEKELTSGFFIVKNGILELMITTEDTEIAIERLYRGSMINHIAFLFEETCHVSARCSDTMTLFYMSNYDMNKIGLRHTELSLEIDKIKLGSKTSLLPTVIDFQEGTRMFPLRRKAEVEAHRHALTRRLKNLALFYLTKVKASRNKASFTQII